MFPLTRCTSWRLAQGAAYAALRSPVGSGGGLHDRDALKLGCGSGEVNAGAGVVASLRRLGRPPE